MRIRNSSLNQWCINALQWFIRMWKTGNWKGVAKPAQNKVVTCATRFEGIYAVKYDGCFYEKHPKWYIYLNTKSKT